MHREIATLHVSIRHDAAEAVGHTNIVTTAIDLVMHNMQYAKDLLAGPWCLSSSRYAGFVALQQH